MTDYIEITNEIEGIEEILLKAKLDSYPPTDEEFKLENLGGDLPESKKEMDMDEQNTGESPYPEVRAAVSPTDFEEGTPVNTLRVWILGLIFVTLGSGANMLFSMRAPSIVITSIVAQLVSFPCGKAMARIPGPKWFNPGPFTMKEHAVITIMSNVSFATGQAYATSIILSQIHYYDQNFGLGFQILLVWTTQIIGYGLAGAARRFLVWPSAMIWPSQLVQCALFRTLHKEGDITVPGWKISRYNFFFVVFVASFIWYWIPGYLFQGLSAFAFVTWIVPKNVTANVVFGQFTGMSLIPLTFDWTQISGYAMSPLQTPWFAIANMMVAMVLWVWIVAPSIYFTNSWWSLYLPFSDSGSYDNTQKPYDIANILTPEKTLDTELYAKYSPLFLSTTFALAYGLSFATIAAVIVHVILYNGKEIVKNFSKSRQKSEDNDVFYRLSLRYPEVPDWWYYSIFVIMFAGGIVVCEAWPTHLPWWGFMLALLISIVWFLPVGIIQAVTNQHMGLNVITEFVIGYMLPGRPLAMMLFKTYGYITTSQGMAFVSDLKLGHYMKIPPRTLFFTQIVATLWASLVEIGVLNWALNNIDDVCQPHQPDHFTCPHARVFFNASVIWGLIGPKNIFSPGQLYSGLLWFFLIGLIAPIPTWYLAKKYPLSFWRFVNWPLIFSGTGSIPPATPLNYFSWGVVGFIFNKVIKSKKRLWWLKYNYILSAGLDVGLAICTMFIFACFTMTNTPPPQWWGNVDITQTYDALGQTNTLILEPGQKFGPTCWYNCKT